MPNQNTPTSPRYTGWFRDQVNGLLEAYYLGTRVFASSATATTIDRAATFSSTLSASTLAATTTITGTSVVANTTGFTSTGGNVFLGTPAAFATTQPVGGIVMGGTSKTGIAPVGAVATSGGLFASDTVCRKIIADGTASNVET